MAEFRNLDDLFNYIQAQASETLESEVADTVTGVMQDHIQEDVYNEYAPTHYARTGKLISEEYIEREMIDDETLGVRSARYDETYSDKYVSLIIEEGDGYTWGTVRNLNSEIGERPFTENTRKDLEKNKQHIKAMKEGLKGRGIKTE